MSNVTVIGSDGQKPNYDPKALFRIWDKAILFMGPNDMGLGKYVPKIFDYAIDLSIHKWYQVIDVDQATLTPTFRALDDEDAAGMDTILVGLGDQPKTMIAYLDTNQLPYSLALDSRHYINGSENSYVRVFRGTDVSDAGEVISAVFSGQTYLDDKIPLELVKYDSHDITNLAEKYVPSFSTNAQLKNGEVITVVVYNASAKITGHKRFKILHGAQVRPVNASQKYITGITLRSIFMNSNDPYKLDFPLNAPIGALNVWGVLTYSDKSEKVLPVDGTKFKLDGLEKFVATRPGQRVPLVLSYRLDTGEFAAGAISVDGKRITEPYSLVTTTENGLYSPTLFGYPRWDEGSNAYVMRWWLMDLNRMTLFDATNYVQYNQSSEQFNGNKYDAMQFLSIRVRLSEVSASLPSWIHTQTLYVKLYNPLAQVRPQGKFEVGQENVAGEFFGEGLVARVNTINQNNFEVNLGNNLTTLNEWLDKMYYKAKPIYSLYRESAPPQPTHFTIINDQQNVQTFPLSQWNRAFKIFTNLQAKGNLIIRWDKQLPNNSTLNLATTELPMDFIS
jgi:hypothetical protein